MTEKARPKSFDFIIVGAGASGALLAARLANTASRPSVLLVEAGGKNDSPSLRADEPIEALNNRAIGYDRGKGLGGSTAINFSCYTIGPKADHDEIARLVGDDEWKWENAHEQYKRIESYDDQIPQGYEKYVAPQLEEHGHDGPIKVGFGRVGEQSAQDLMDIWLANGAKPNLDSNLGDPIGVSLVWSSAQKGHRSTSADALTGAGTNLHILTDNQVARVIFDGERASAIETLDGTHYFADKEIILSAGSVDTPRLLLHSGIGPRDQLQEFNIPVVRHNGNVGQHLRDHLHAVFSYERAEHTGQRHKFYRSKELQAKARAQWEEDGTGPLAELGVVLGIGWSKHEAIYNSKEFQELPADKQQFLRDPTVPHSEFILNGLHLDHIVNPEGSRAGTTVFLFLMNQQSAGEMRLTSADPSIPLKFFPNFFSHPYDRRAAVEATRDMLKVINSPEFQRDAVAVQKAPKSDSEEDILSFWRESSNTTWHMMGTARMGLNEDEAVVNNEFKVFGVNRLRVVDLSVIPHAVNNHTQTTGYLAASIAADKLVSQYGLDA
ncbi:hypothetical protein B0A52_04745 [Exophiala mesophila]|uniref:Glucose-methanol-choline oxidoreductase N-terminal domain-containing protein n=1 Tax=Exophiala mesophila TaxID=212818 RepID=A0A438N8P4_EXOME|nr:hypothetical protein B0A52_04745 [Exophiala mesophila]